MKHTVHRITTFLLCAFCLAPAALAQDLDDILQAELRPGWRTEDGIHMAALQLDMAPGWKTYWRQPGDSGIPPRFDFSQSVGVQPSRFFTQRQKFRGSGAAATSDMKSTSFFQCNSPWTALQTSLDRRMRSCVPGAVHPCYA